MKTKIVMIATLAVSLVTLVATVSFGIANWKNRWIAEEWDFSDEEEGAENAEE